MFAVFRSRTSAYYFSQDLKHGGAAYIPTGRGYALRHISFVRTYTAYARSHIYYAVSVRSTLQQNEPCNTVNRTMCTFTRSAQPCAISYPVRRHVGYALDLGLADITLGNSVERKAPGF